jgi:hypothetical protein
MAEAKKTDRAEEKTEPKAPEPPKLGRAAESGDAAVHNLLAERSIHDSNGDTDRVADVDRRLAELGLSAQ